MNSPPPKTILIVGMARSGSTLLGLLLGQVPGLLNIGELMHLWDRGFREDHFCGCGMKFSECNFWSGLAANKDWGLVENATDLHAALERAQNHHSLHRNLGRQLKKPKDYEMIRESMSEAIAAISQRGAANYLVDGSKQPVYARFLSRVVGRENLHIIHIVRDPRGVAYSGAQLKRKPDAGSNEVFMVRRPPLKTAIAWIKLILSGMSLKAYARTYQTLRYEDLCTDPDTAINGVLSNIEPQLAVSRHEYRIAKGLAPEIQHTISGNPMRMNTEKLDIVADERWRRKLSELDYFLVTALCAPFLRVYRYNLKR